MSDHPNWLLTADAKPTRTLVGLFEAQAAASPLAVAATFGTERLTYGGLNERANRLAHCLIAEGAGPDDLVAILLEPGLDLLVAMLAALKAGAAYLPLDPRDPPARIAAMLRDAQPVALLYGAGTAPPLPADRPEAAPMDLPIWAIDGAEAARRLRAAPAHNPTDAERAAPLLPAQAAYVIYTSGSTGQPKGVIVSHHNVVRLFAATRHWFSFGPGDTWTLFHSFCFDFSVWEIWGALLHGGRLVVVPPAIVRSPPDFLNLLAAERVTVLNQTPSAFYGLMRAEAERPDLCERLALRLVIFGGEALEFRRLAPWYRRHAEDRPRLVNMYGITETTVHVSYLPLTRALAETSSDSLIGEAIPDLQIHVLDERLRPVPDGAIGEMYIQGAGLARGYLRRPELTAERFVASPFGAPGERLYRTGDLARRRADGAIAYCGRSDQQVKVRGHRVETGEVAAALAGLDGVADAAVAPHRDAGGNTELIGYVVMRAAAPFDPIRLRRALAARLPPHMMPATLVALAALPLTRNGKLDRAALPGPVRHDGGQPQGASQRTQQEAPPADEVERAVAAIWQRVLRLERVERDTNFFDAGGNSLLIWDVHEAIRRELGVEVPIAIIFAHPSVASLARHLKPAAAAAGGPAAQVRAARQAEALRRFAEPRGEGTLH